MALKKSELYSSLWAGCDELRGGMDASQYKDYVLVLLFIKYVSDKYAGVFVADVFDEEEDEDVVLVLAGVHAAAQFVAAGPEGAVEFGFLERHCSVVLEACRATAREISRPRNAYSLSFGGWV